MSTYRLPDWLGGHEARLNPDVTAEYSFLALIVAGPDGVEWSIEVAEEMVTKVEPPLPPEPPDGFVGRQPPRDGRSSRIWERDDRAWGEDDVRHWWGTGFEKPFSWAELLDWLDGDELIPLVPDPAHGAPELPYYVYGDQGYTALRVTAWPSLLAPRTGAIDVLGNTSELTVEELEATGAAILSVARRIRSHEASASERAT